MKVTFLGAAHEVTGSCTLLEVGDKKGVIDCGMEQGKDLFENQELPVAAGVEQNGMRAVRGVPPDADVVAAAMLLFNEGDEVRTRHVSF